MYAIYITKIYISGKFGSFLEHGVTNGSIMTMLAISFERYYAICRPLEVLYTCTKSRAVKIIISVWVFSAISACPFFIISYTELSQFHRDSTMQLTCRSPIDTTWKDVYTLAIFVMFFLLPCIMLMLLYLYICRELLRSQRGMAQNESIAFSSVQPGAKRSNKNGGKETSNSKSQTSSVRSQYSVKQSRTVTSRRQVIYMLIAVIVFSFSCLLPFRIVTLWLIYSSMSAKKQLSMQAILVIMHLSRILFYANSAGNPILYNMMSTKFREASKRSLGGIWCDRKQPVSPCRTRVPGPQSRHASCRRYDSSTKADVFEFDSVVPLTCNSNGQNARKVKA